MNFNSLYLKFILLAYNNLNTGTAFTQGEGGVLFIKVSGGTLRGTGCLMGGIQYFNLTVDDNEIFSPSSSRQRVSNT